MYETPLVTEVQWHDPVIGLYHETLVSAIRLIGCWDHVVPTLLCLEKLTTMEATEAHFFAQELSSTHRFSVHPHIFSNSIPGETNSNHVVPNWKNVHQTWFLCKKVSLCGLCRQHKYLSLCQSSVSPTCCHSAGCQANGTESFSVTK